MMAKLNHSIDRRTSRWRRLGGQVWMLVLCGLLSGALLSGNGCASSKPAAGQMDPDAQFDAGAGRAPNARTMYTLARILAAQGRDRECITVLTRTTRQYAGFLPAYSDLAEAYLRLGRTDDGIAVLDQGLRQAPQDPVLLNNLGMCWFLKGDYTQALRLFSRASMARPEDVTYKGNQAAALGMLGRTAEATALYSQFMASPDVRHNMSVLARARNGNADLAATTEPAPTAQPEAATEPAAP
jgi:Flp pilus assembly protein TadD